MIFIFPPFRSFGYFLESLKWAGPHCLRFKEIILRVFTVAVEINSHGKGLSHPSANVKALG
jgi:hypothetical protein